MAGGGSNIVKRSLEDFGAAGKARELKRAVRGFIGRWAQTLDGQPVQLDRPVREIMSRGVVTCSAADTLQRAAQIMWERDCGIVPVVDSDGRVVGVVTDRDLCMASYTQGRALSAVPLSWVLSGRIVHTCTPTDSVDRAVALMREQRVRRLVVVDGQQKVVGVVALADIARHVASLAASEPRAALILTDLIATLSERRGGGGSAERAAE